jgi:hypothetical protein
MFGIEGGYAEQPAESAAMMNDRPGCRGACARGVQRAQQDFNKKLNYNASRIAPARRSGVPDVQARQLLRA